MGLTEDNFHNVNLDYKYSKENPYEYSTEHDSVTKPRVSLAAETGNAYVSSEYLNGPVNLLRNESLFTDYKPGAIDDLTGMIGVTYRNGVETYDGKTNGWYDHVYVNLGNNNGIVESTGGIGVNIEDFNRYAKRTKYYLQLNLLDNRRSVRWEWKIC